MNQLSGIKIDKSLKLDSTLYRYIDLSQFLSFVETKKIYLTKIMNWQDNWEIPTNRIPQVVNGQFQPLELSIYDNMFGQCWSFENFSDAMWRIYSPNKEGLMINTSVKKFLLMENQVECGRLGPVIYYDNLKQALDENKALKGFKSVVMDAFLKRKAFDHEKEVRMVTIYDKNHLSKKIKNCESIEVNLDPIDFIEGITIDPRANERYVNTVKEYCKRAGFTIEPVKSNLYADVHEETQLVHWYEEKRNPH